MIITFFTPTLKLTGGNSVMFRYAEYLASKGAEVFIAAPDCEKKDYTENGVHIKTFKKIPNRYFEHIFFQLIYLRNFFELTCQSDIIIPVFFPLALHAIYCKKRNKCRYIIPLFQDFKKMFWFGRYIYFLLGLKQVTKYIDEFIAVSDIAAQEIKQYTAKDAVIIKNGIEHEYFYPRDLKKENYILFVGSASKSKGLEYFLKAFDIIKKEFPAVRGAVVSPCALKFKNSSIEAINIGNDRNKLGEIYSKALIYVSQSLGDSFGLPPLEAMASGTAVVLTNTAGSGEYALNEVNSLIVPVKNPQKTADAVLRIVKNESLRHDLEKNGIKTAAEYNWNNSCEKLTELIRRFSD